MYAQQRKVFRVAIQKVYDENRQIFGAGKITAILKEQGYVTSEDTVRRLMDDMKCPPLIGPRSNINDGWIPWNPSIGVAPKP